MFHNRINFVFFFLDKVKHYKYNVAVNKDTAYSIRMNSFVLQTLKRAAKKERRTVASLLDKIIIDYLEKEGFIRPPDIGEERRGSQRRKLALPATAVFRTASKIETFPAVILDISQGGVLITYPKGEERLIPSLRELPRFELHFKLPQFEEQVHFSCEARRLHETVGEIQIGASFLNHNEPNLRKLRTFLK